MIQDEEAKRRVLTVLGRTSAPVATCLIGTEKATEFAGALATELDEEYRAQTTSASTDSPSQEQYTRLKEVLRNLRNSSADPIHPVITYEVAHYRKKTEGSARLRHMMHKFCKVDRAKTAESFGDVYTGGRLR